MKQNMTEQQLQSLDIKKMTVEDWRDLTSHDDIRLRQIDAEKIAEKAVRHLSAIHNSEDGL